MSGFHIYIWKNRAQKSQNILEIMPYTIEILNVSNVVTNSIAKKGAIF